MNHTGIANKLQSTDELRLVCDEMLLGLARWLRAAGHDTQTVSSGVSDRQVLEQAVVEDIMSKKNKRGQLKKAGSTKTAFCGRSIGIGCV